MSTSRCVMSEERGEDECDDCPRGQQSSVCGCSIISNPLACMHCRPESPKGDVRCVTLSHCMPRGKYLRLFSFSYPNRSCDYAIQLREVVSSSRQPGADTWPPLTSGSSRHRKMQAPVGRGPFPSSNRARRSLPEISRSQAVSSRAPLRSAGFAGLVKSMLMLAYQHRLLSFDEAERVASWLRRWRWFMEG